MNLTKRSVLVLLAFASLTGIASADVTKADNDTDLNIGASWVGGVAPTAADLMIVDTTLTADRTAALGDNVSVLGIANSSSNTLTVNHTAGKILTIGASGIKETGAGGLTFNNAVSLGGNVTLPATQVGPVTFAGGLTLPTNQTWALGGSATVSNTISINGPLSILWKVLTISSATTNSGILSISGDNTFGNEISIGTIGNVYVQSGTVTFNGTANACSSFKVFGGTANITSMGTNNGASSLGKGSAFVQSGATLNYTGITAASDKGFSRDGNGTTTISVTQAGQTLSMNNTLTTVTGGSTGGWVFGGAGNLTLSNAIGNATSTTVTKQDGGTLALFGANAYTGATTVNAGTLALGFGTVALNIINSSSALTLGGGTLQLTGAGNQTVAGLTTTANTGSRILLGANETLTLGALTSAGANSALNFNTVAGGANATTPAIGTGIIVLTGQTPGNTIDSGFTVSDAGGFGLATVNGSDQVIRQTTGLTLLPASGATSATDYHIDNNAGGAAAAGSSTLAITASSSAKSITVDTTTNGTLTLNSGVVLSNNIWNFGGVGTNTYLITGNAGGAGLASVASSDTININNYNAGLVTIATPILANGANAVNINGTGPLKLSGTNTYTGTTTLGSGKLHIGVNNEGSVGAITSSAVGTGALALNGGAISSDSTTARTNLNAVTFGGDVTLGDATNTGKLTFSANADLGGGARTLTAASAAQFDGVVSNGGLIKAGAGTLTLTGANTYNGGTVVNAGTLIVTNAGTLGTSANALTINGGTLNLGTHVTVGSFAMNGGTLNGSGTMTVAGTAKFNGTGNGGTTSVKADTIVLGGSFNGGSQFPSVSSITVGSGGIWVDSSYNNINAAAANITLSTNQTWGGMGFYGNARLDISGTLNANGYNLYIARFSILGLNGNYTFDTNVTFGAQSNFRVGGTAGQTITFNGTNNVLGSFLVYVSGVTANVASIGNTGAKSSIGTGNATIAAGATLNYTGNTFSSNKGLSGGGNVNSTFNVTTAGQTLSMSGNLTSSAGTAGWAFGGAGNLTLSGVINNNGSTTVTKKDAGTLTLSGTNTYAGGTIISNGLLLVNGSISTGAVTVAIGGTLGGTGTVRGEATVDGSVAPGSGGIGTLTTSNVTWNAGVAWPYDLGDRLAINGAFSKGTGSSFTFDLQSVGGAGVYTLVTWSASTDFVDGDFAADNVPGGLTPTFTVNANELTLTLAGGGSPILGVSPASLDFGGVQVGSSSSLVFVVTNSGAALLTGNAAVSLAQYAIAGSTNFSVAPGASADITITFTPSLADSYADSVTFLSDGGGLTNAITGYGYIIAGSTNASIGLVGGQVTFGFSMASGALYRVQASTNLLIVPNSGFVDVTAPLTNRGSGLIIYTNTTSDPAQMFRIQSP